MCFTCTFVGCRRRVAAHHLTGSPAGQPHQVTLVPAVLEPLVGEGMAEAVGVHVGYAGLRGAAGDHLSDAVRGERSLRAEPQPRVGGEAVAGALAQVPVDRLERRSTEGTGAPSSAFAEHPGDGLFVVDI